MASIFEVRFQKAKVLTAPLYFFKIFFKFYFIFKLYIIVLVLPNIKMNIFLTNI